jgi:hypothetical protein
VYGGQWWNINWHETKTAVAKTKNSGYRLLQKAVRRYECLEQGRNDCGSGSFGFAPGPEPSGGRYFCCLIMCVYVVITMSI